MKHSIEIKNLSKIDCNDNKTHFTGIVMNDNKIDIFKKFNQISHTVENLTRKLFTKNEWDSQILKPKMNFFKILKMRGTKKYASNVKDEADRANREFRLSKAIIKRLITEKRPGNFLINRLSKGGSVILEGIPYFPPKENKRSVLTNYLNNSKRISSSDNIDQKIMRPKIKLVLNSNNNLAKNHISNLKLNIKSNKEHKVKEFKITPNSTNQNIFLTTTDSYSQQDNNKLFYKTNHTFSTSTKTNTQFLKTHSQLNDQLTKLNTFYPNIKTNKIGNRGSCFSINSNINLTPKIDNDDSQIETKKMNKSDFKFSRINHIKNLSSIAKICNTETEYLQNTNEKLEKFINFLKPASTSYKDKLPPEKIEEDNIFRPQNYIKKYFIYGHGMFMSEEKNVDELLDKHDKISNVHPSAAYKFRNILGDHLGVRVTHDNNLFQLKDIKSYPTDKENHNAKIDKNSFKLRKLINITGKTKLRLDQIINKNKK